MMDPVYDRNNVQLYCGDALEVLRELPDNTVHCCITSPPYFGLRDYGIDGQIGLEETPEEYVVRLVEVFREVRRVPNHYREKITKAWRPACDCGGEPVPCVVLDPFSGAGTTAMVAATLGRKAIGIELNPDYLKMSIKRLNTAQLRLFA